MCSRRSEALPGRREGWYQQEERQGRVSTGAPLVFSNGVGLNSLPANVFASQLLPGELPWLRKRGVKSEGEKHEKTVACLLCVGTWVVRGLDRVGAGADYFGNCARRRT